ncbi:MAG: hypothetical protein AABM40_14915 [Chloroflexota bacterium]
MAFEPPDSDSLETRKRTLTLCRDALRKYVGRFHEIADELFVVGRYTVRPKGTGTAKGDWVWDLGGAVPVREDFYLLVDVNVADDFYIVPSDYVRGAVEAGHHTWYETRGPGESRDLEGNSMRRLMKWPVRHFKNRWDLLRPDSVAPDAV